MFCPRELHFCRLFRRRVARSRAVWPVWVTLPFPLLSSSSWSLISDGVGYVQDKLNKISVLTCFLEHGWPRGLDADKRPYFVFSCMTAKKTYFGSVPWCCVRHCTGYIRTESLLRIESLDTCMEVAWALLTYFPPPTCAVGSFRFFSSFRNTQLGVHMDIKQ